MTERLDNPLIRELYESQEQHYADIRHLHTDSAMTKRINSLRRMLIPLTKRINRNVKFHTLNTEYCLLRRKRELYQDNTPSLALVRWRLQLNDRYSWSDPESVEECRERKKEHLLLLLNIDLYEKADKEILELLSIHK